MGSVRARCPGRHPAPVSGAIVFAETSCGGWPAPILARGQSSAPGGSERCSRGIAGCASHDLCEVGSLPHLSQDSHRRWRRLVGSGLQAPPASAKRASTISARFISAVLQPERIGPAPLERIGRIGGSGNGKLVRRAPHECGAIHGFASFLPRRPHTHLVSADRASDHEHAGLAGSK